MGALYYLSNRIEKHRVAHKRQLAIIIFLPSPNMQLQRSMFMNHQRKHAL